MPRVQIQIVTWNNRKDIAAAMESVMNQTWKDISVVVIDNASEDGTMDILKRYGKEITVLANRRNLGFAQAHNQAYRFALQSRTVPDYILVMNPDGSLTPHYLETMLAFAEVHQDGASFCGKVLREAADSAATIDTTGIMMKKSFRAYDRGAGEMDRGQYHESSQVFGASGALALYRVALLKTVAADGAMYDQNFFMYKEDVDLAWRLERAGYCAYYVAEAFAYHMRTVRASAHGAFGKLRGELKKDPYKKYLSYRNQRLLWKKNLSMKVFLRHLPWVLADRVSESLFMLFVHPRYFVRAHVDLVRLSLKSRQKKNV